MLSNSCNAVCKRLPHTLRPTPERSGHTDALSSPHAPCRFSGAFAHAAPSVGNNLLSVLKSGIPYTSGLTLMSRNVTGLLWPPIQTSPPPAAAPRLLRSTRYNSQSRVCTVYTRRVPSAERQQERDVLPTATPSRHPHAAVQTDENEGHLKRCSPFSLPREDMKGYGLPFDVTVFNMTAGMSRPRAAETPKSPTLIL